MAFSGSQPPYLSPVSSGAAGRGGAGLSHEEAAVGLWEDDYWVAAGEEGNCLKEDTGRGTESQVGES